MSGLRKNASGKESGKESAKVSATGGAKASALGSSVKISQKLGGKGSGKVSAKVSAKGSAKGSARGSVIKNNAKENFNSLISPASSSKEPSKQSSRRSSMSRGGIPKSSVKNPENYISNQTHDLPKVIKPLRKPLTSVKLGTIENVPMVGSPNATRLPNGLSGSHTRASLKVSLITSG